ncbi:MAG: metallophosphoesterase family protein [Spirochaetota bacterium]
MRIALLSDLHANLPFAEAAVRRARFSGCDRIVHLGDAIDLGPWPSETLDYLIDEGVELIRGNHDEYPILGITPALDSRLAPGIRAHMEWTASQLRADQLALLAALPARIDARVDEWRVRFQHYLLDGDRVSDEYLGEDHAGIVRRFGVSAGEIVGFGHIHSRLWHFTGERGVLNPGATGFHGSDGAWFAVLVIRELSAWVEWHPVECSSQVVVCELERRRVPDWQASAHYMFETAASL